MQKQIQQFRQILAENGLSVDDFELNVDGETFRALMAGQPADLEVVCRSSQVSRTYRHDGGDAWLEQFARDLQKSLFD